MLFAVDPVHVTRPKRLTRNRFCRARTKQNVLMENLIRGVPPEMIVVANCTDWRKLSARRKSRYRGSNIRNRRFPWTNTKTSAKTVSDRNRPRRVFVNNVCLIRRVKNIRDTNGFRMKSFGWTARYCFVRKQQLSSRGFQQLFLSVSVISYVINNVQTRFSDFPLARCECSFRDP